MTSSMTIIDPTAWPAVENDLADDEVRERLRQAHVVLGHDRSSGPDAINVFGGRDRLAQIAKSRQPQKLDLFGISYAQTTTSLEKLIAACRVLRGSCDYVSNQIEPDQTPTDHPQ
ncbi:MAG: hypothetical protein DHS20C21_18420 [Gemmatimonadota bacterium]|nr:MAG: hypothetical protein DHS20C21_18420 [Gemmatimonadota bacterium]